MGTYGKLVICNEVIKGSLFSDKTYEEDFLSKILGIEPWECLGPVFSWSPDRFQASKSQIFQFSVVPLAWQLRRFVSRASLDVAHRWGISLRRWCSSLRTQWRFRNERRFLTGNFWRHGDMKWVRFQDPTSQPVPIYVHGGNVIGKWDMNGICLLLGLDFNMVTSHQLTTSNMSIVGGIWMGYGWKMENVHDGGDYFNGIDGDKYGGI